MNIGMSMESCSLCPRECKVNRQEGIIGRCKVPSELIVSRAALHMWEEPCISGEEGSGTVFFSGCSLGCVYCQNRGIAIAKQGKRISVERLAEIFLELQDKKANNINLVTPSHYVIPIKEAIILAKKQGLNLPIVYNSSGYEKVTSLKSLEGLIDIYLPDFKYLDSNLAKKYSNAPDYAKYAKEALAEMVRQVPQEEFDERGIMRKGIIVRHLALPGCMEDSKKILSYLYQTYGDQIAISIMNQFTPLEHVKAYKELNRTLSVEEYEELVDFAIDIGIENGFIQEGETAKDSFIPDFNCEGV